MIVLIVTRDGHAVEYSRDTYLVKFTDYGVSIINKQPGGWVSKVYPWSNIGLVEERKEG